MNRTETIYELITNMTPMNAARLDLLVRVELITKAELSELLNRELEEWQRRLLVGCTGSEG
jgi:hypothetical protein